MRLTDFFLGKTEIMQNQPMQETVQPANSAAVQRLIQSLVPGQTIQGEIMSKNGSEVEIRLDNLVQLKAALERDMNLEVGNLMSFQVKNNGQALTLSPLFANTATDMTTLKALDMAGLPVNEKSVNMTRQMMQEGMPIDRNHLSAMYREISQFREYGVEDILDLHKLNMPVNRETLEQLAGYKNTSYQFEAGVSQVAEHLTDALEQIAQQGSVKDAVQVLADIWNLLEETPETKESANEQEASVRTPVSAEEATAQSTEKESPDIQKTIITQSNAKPVPAGEMPLLSESNTKPDAAGASAKEVPVPKTGDVPEQEKQPLRQEAAGQEQERTQLQPEKAQTAARGIYLEQPAGEQEKGDAAQTNAQPAQTVFVPEQDIGRLLQTAVSRQDNELIQKLWDSKELVSLLKEKFVAQNKITPSQVADKEEVKEFYNKLDKTLTGMERILENAQAKDTAAYQDVKNLNQNVDFLNQINQVYQFVQLPLRLSDSSAHGDLYVYSNKKNLASQDGKVSAYLHLDMEHLGPVGVYVTLENQKVDTNFTLANDEMLDFIESHMDMLTDRLNKRGYQVSFTLSKDEKVATKEGIEPVLPKQTGDRLLQEMAFDVRA